MRQVLESWWRSRRFGPRLVLEVCVVLGALVAYRTVRLFTGDDERRAFANAAEVIGFEKAVGAFIEPTLQQIALAAEPLITALNWYYVIGHFPGTTALLIWLWFARPHIYPHVRRVLVYVTFVGLVLHLAYPLAPPRMFPREGFVDTMMTYGPKIYDEGIAEGVNVIAAMPSLHVGWAVAVAYALIVSSRRRLRWIAVAHPTITFATVVLTANHWWIDGAVAILLVVLAVWLDRRVKAWAARRQARQEAIEVDRPADTGELVTSGV